MQDFPPFCFPYEACPHGRKREIFARYGSLGQCDVNEQGQIVNQRLKGHHSYKYAAVHPVLPLLTSPEEVVLPWKDRIMGKLLAEKSLVKNFISKMDITFSKNKKNLSKEEILEQVMEKIQSTDDLDLDELFESTPWLQELYHQYISVSSITGIQTNNYRYAGDGLAYLPHTEDDGYVVSAAGPGCSTLKLRHVYELGDGVLRAEDVSEVAMSGEVLGIKGQRTQGQDYVCVRMDSVCELYTVLPDSALQQSDSAHSQLQYIDTIRCSGHDILATDISPYIPGECLFTNADGSCHLWSNGHQLKKVLGPIQPRFPVSDVWAQATFGSHPRQIVYADQTAVQMHDLRKTGPEAAVDLFCLPSKFLQQRERIRACARHSASPFYHIIATDYSLFLMDERFPQCPVLQWDHLLFSPPQYISTLSAPAETPVNPSCMGTGFVYVGSQYPGDVHGFRFSLGTQTPPQAMGLPWRAARISDLSQWLEFSKDCPNPDLIKQRLSGSLAGVVVSKWQKGHVVIQTNSYGDLFHQVFQDASNIHQDVTFSAGPGSDDLKLTPIAIETAQTWIASLEEKIHYGSQLQGKVALKDASCLFDVITDVSRSARYCVICNPDQSTTMEPSSENPHQGDVMDPGPCDDAPEPHDTPVSSDTSESASYLICLACTHSSKEQQQLLQSVENDTIMPWLDVAETHHDGLMTEFPCDKALSKLLMKHWEKDEDIKEILEQKDAEVKEYMKQRRENRSKNELEDMSEEAVLQRFQNISQQQQPESHSAEQRTSTASTPSSDSETSDREPPDKQPAESGDEIIDVTSENGKSKSISKSSCKALRSIRNDNVDDKTDNVYDTDGSASIFSHTSIKSSSSKSKRTRRSLAVDSSNLEAPVLVPPSEGACILNSSHYSDGSASIFSHASIGSSSSKRMRRILRSNVDSSSLEAPVSEHPSKEQCIPNSSHDSDGSASVFSRTSIRSSSSKSKRTQISVQPLNEQCILNSSHETDRLPRRSESGNAGASQSINVYDSDGSASLFSHTSLRSSSSHSKSKRKQKFLPVNNECDKADTSQSINVYDSDGSASLFSLTSLRSSSSHSKSTRKRRISAVTGSSLETAVSHRHSLLPANPPEKQSTLNSSLNTDLLSGGNKNASGNACASDRIGRISDNHENVDDERMSGDRRRTLESNTQSSLSGLSKQNESSTYFQGSSQRSTPKGVLSSSNLSLTVPSQTHAKASPFNATLSQSSRLFRTFASPLVTSCDMPSSPVRVRLADTFPGSSSPVRVRLADTYPGSSQGATTGNSQLQSPNSARKLTSKTGTHSTPALKKSTPKARRKIHIDGF